MPAAAEKIPARTVYRFKLPIRTEAQLRAFVEHRLGLRIPNVHVCPDHATPWEAFRDAYFARSTVAIWEASRGFGGKSFMLAALGVIEAETLKCDVNILGGSGEQSRRVHEYMGRFLVSKTAPRTENGAKLLPADPATYLTRLSWGNKITALTASQTSVRGPHIPRLRMDEVDEMDIDILDAATGQTMDMVAGDTLVMQQTVLSSTHQHPDGTFTEIKKRAAEKAAQGIAWPIYKWCYKENMEPHGWLSQANVDKKKGDVTKAMWEAEYDLEEPNPQDRAIFPEFVERCFNPELGIIKDRDGEYIEIEPPDPHGEYSHGTDWGRKVDFSCVVTLRIDVHPARIVAFRRGHRQPWPILANWLDFQIERYGVQVSKRAHDATGIGDPVEGYLRNTVEAVVLTGHIRVEIFNAWIIAIESHEVEGARIESMYEEHKFVGRGIFGEGEHPPDTFVAGALAWHARNQSRVRVL